MKESTRHDRLREQTAEELRRVEGREARVTRLGRSAVRVGDLFVFRETADFSVEWAVIDREPGVTGRFHVVIADTHPFSCEGDVEVAAGSSAGPLWLRCRFNLWLGRSLFETSELSGSVARETTARARASCERWEAGNVESEVRSPDYEDWESGVLEPAFHRLQAAEAEGGDPADRSQGQERRGA